MAVLVGYFGHKTSKADELYPVNTRFTAMLEMPHDRTGPLQYECQLMIVRKGRTIKRICEAVAAGALTEPFSAADINRSLGITYAPSFLAAHRVGNPRGVAEFFIQISHRPALFRLASKVAPLRKNARAGKP